MVMTADAPDCNSRSCLSHIQLHMSVYVHEATWHALVCIYSAWRVGCMRDIAGLRAVSGAWLRKMMDHFE